MDKKTLLRTSGLTIGYATGGNSRVRRSDATGHDGKRAAKKASPVAGPISVAIRPGQLICLLGPNGSGKSTLLRTLAGLQPALKGVIEIEGRPSGKFRPVSLAKKISLVLTDPVRGSNLSVYSLVALGRYPYSGWLGTLDEADKTIIARAMESTGISVFSDRKMSTLSDGESQKVMLARAIAQDTPLMMLDEPTAHLDLPSRIQLMQLLHQLARNTNKGILFSTHELDLALQVADEIWLMQAGGGFHQGAPEDLVLDGTFEAAFEKEGIRFDKSTGAFTMHHANEKNIGFTGEGAAAFWTKRALARHGYRVVVDRPPGPGVSSHAAEAVEHVNVPDTPAIEVLEQAGRTIWVLDHRGEVNKYERIAELLSALIEKEAG